MRTDPVADHRCAAYYARLLVLAGESAPSSSGPVPMAIPVQNPEPTQVVDGPEPFVDNSLNRKTMCVCAKRGGGQRC